ncbi:hypothetical protein KCV00_g353, partial [Aureobasidium melanogenum]
MEIETGPANNHQDGGEMRVLIDRFTLQMAIFNKPANTEIAHEHLDVGMQGLLVNNKSDARLVSTSQTLCQQRDALRVPKSVTSIVLRPQRKARSILQKGIAVSGEEACPSRADRLLLLSGHRSHRPKSLQTASTQYKHYQELSKSKPGFQTSGLPVRQLWLGIFTMMTNMNEKDDIGKGYQCIQVATMLS